MGMVRHLSFALFITAFFESLLLFNLYVLSSLFQMLELELGWAFLAFAVASSLSFVIAMGLRDTMSCWASKSYYVAASTWLGFLIYLFFAAVAYDVLGLVEGLNRRPFVPFLIASTLTMLAISVFLAKYIMLRRINVPCKKLKREVTIAHISDIHIGASRGSGGLKRVVELTNSARPDIVLITGDLIDSPLKVSDNPLSALDDFHVPVYFTLGNHEYYAGVDEVVELLSKTRARVLRGEVAALEDLTILGVDYGDDLEAAVDSLRFDRSICTILMYHSPAGFATAESRGIDLFLAGHTHGGQFFPFTAIARLIWGRGYRGLHRRGESYLYTSTGAGTWGPPMRFGTRSEVAIITMRPSTGGIFGSGP
jgi:hypothetical protein